jgi:hypothetical protein
MNLLDPSKMDAVQKARLSKMLDRLSLLSLLAALWASSAGLILYLVDSSLILTVPWAVVAVSAMLATLAGIVLGIRKWRKP